MRTPASPLLWGSWCNSTSGTVFVLLLHSTPTPHAPQPPGLLCRDPPGSLHGWQPPPHPTATGSQDPRTALPHAGCRAGRSLQSCPASCCGGSLEKSPCPWSLGALFAKPKSHLTHHPQGLHRVKAGDTACPDVQGHADSRHFCALASALPTCSPEDG